MQNWNQYMNLFLESVREVCVYRNLDHTTFMTCQREQNFLFKSVQIPTELFCNLLIQYFPKKQVQRVKKQFLEQVAKTAITQDMYRVLNEIENARCILKDALIVILDEATASVDMDNESYIQEAINELVKGKTLLVIAHRLNTMQSAN